MLGTPSHSHCNCHGESRLVGKQELPTEVCTQSSTALVATLITSRGRDMGTRPQNEMLSTPNQQYTYVSRILDAENIDYSIVAKEKLR